MKCAGVLEEAGDLEATLSTLDEAAAHLDKTGDERDRWQLAFTTAKTLGRLNRYAAADALLPGLCHLSVGTGRRLDQLRLQWLAAKIGAGLGRCDAACKHLEQVHQGFLALGIAPDVIVSGLDLAALYLDAQRWDDVRALAAAMAEIGGSIAQPFPASAPLQQFLAAVAAGTADGRLVRRLAEQLGGPSGCVIA